MLCCAVAKDYYCRLVDILEFRTKLVMLAALHFHAFSGFYQQDPYGLYTEIATGPDETLLIC